MPSHCGHGPNDFDAARHKRREELGRNRIANMPWRRLMFDDLSDCMRSSGQNKHRSLKNTLYIYKLKTYNNNIAALGNWVLEFWWSLCNPLLNELDNSHTPNDLRCTRSPKAEIFLTISPWLLKIEDGLFMIRGYQSPVTGLSVDINGHCQNPEFEDKTQRSQAGTSPITWQLYINHYIWCCIV